MIRMFRCPGKGKLQSVQRYEMNGSDHYHVYSRTAATKEVVTDIRNSELLCIYTESEIIKHTKLMLHKIFYFRVCMFVFYTMYGDKEVEIHSHRVFPFDR